MKRREFLKRTAPALAVPVLLNGLSVRALAAGNGAADALAAVASDAVLVVIQLQGGNDGLNTVIPVDDDIYYRLRPTMKIEKAAALPLDGMPLLRMNPVMAGMQRLYNAGRLAIVQNVGYGQTGGSHFVETEVWQTATGLLSGNAVSTGWIGRYLKREFPGFPEELPNDPPAVEIGRATSSMFTVVGGSISMSLTDPAEFHALVQGVPSGHGDPGADTPAGREKAFVDSMDRQSHAYADSIRAAAGRAKNLTTYPADSELAESLAIIARLIAGGLGTRVYKVVLGGFDTHAHQAVQHPALLATLSDAVAAFQDDLDALGVAERVVGMTYSEFGRRAADNGNGTDHGAAAPHFVFGARVQGGAVYGGLPALNDLDRVGNLKHTVDFTCYYASVLAPLFDIGEAAMREILPAGPCAPADYVPVLRPRASAAPIVSAEHDALRVVVAPSPTAGPVTITLTAPQGSWGGSQGGSWGGSQGGSWGGSQGGARSGFVDVALVDASGARARQLYSGPINGAALRIAADLRGLPSGTYFVVAERGTQRTTARLVMTR